MKKMALVILVLVMAAPFLVGTKPAQPQALCDYNTHVEAVVNQINETSWVSWINDLSGENAVALDSMTTTIYTRYSEALFNGNPRARAYDYVLQELAEMGYETGTTLLEHAYTPWVGLEWRNIIAVLPGQGIHADEIVLMTAHLDSTSSDVYSLAPGAEDNASGVATLLEAARLLRQYQFDRTIKFIFFTGEEQGLIGSRAYVASFPDEMAQIVGVVNLDMFGYDQDQDRCFELHVGTLAASDIVGQCFADTITNYGLDLSYDYLTDTATSRSDHASFWSADVGAIEVLENFFDNNQQDGCSGYDRNPHYHRITDTVDKLYMPAAVDIAKGGVATVAGLAIPLDICFTATPTLISVTPGETDLTLTWEALSGADRTLVYRTAESCSAPMSAWRLISTTNDLTLVDSQIIPGETYAYRIAAAGSPAICISSQSNCLMGGIDGTNTYIPWINQ